MTSLAHGNPSLPIHKGLTNNFNAVKQLLTHRLNEFTGTGGALQKLKQEWKESSNMRLLIGAGLLTGGLVATATGAAGTAGLILATRTIISSLGAYITTEELCNKFMADETPADKKKKIIIASTSALVMGIIGGGGVLNILHDTPAVDTLGKGSIGYVGNTAPVTSNEILAYQGVNMSEVIQDIQHDHPTQGYITLEQTIRRIEGLSQGIGLHESEKLNALNESVSKLVHAPDGKVVEIMQSLGYLDNGETVDTASRKLRVEDISNIATRYAEEHGPRAVIQETNLGSTPPVNSLPYDISTAGEVLTPAPILSHTPESTPQKQYLPWWITTGIGIAVASSYAWFSRKKQRVSSEAQPEEIPSTENMESTQNIATSLPQDTSNASIQTDALLPQSSNREDIPYVLNAEQMTAKGIITEYFTSVYNWEPIHTENSSGEYTETFLGRSVGGAFITTVHYCESGIWFETLWNNKDGFHPLEISKFFSPLSITSPLDRENGFHEQFDTYFLENCKTRDKIGCALLKEVTKYALTREMLREIYNQADSPDFHNLETQGSLYANSQEIQDGILRFIFHVLPKKEELEVESTMVTLRGETGGIFVNQKPIDLIWRTHSEKEARIMIAHIDTICNTPYPTIFIGNPENPYYKVNGVMQNTFSGVHAFPGSIVHRIWHKHPPGIPSPSGGDLINGEMDMMNRYRGLEYFFHFIVMPISEQEISRYQNDPYFHLLSRNEYEGTQSYLISGYKYKANGRGSGNDVTKLKLVIE